MLALTSCPAKLITAGSNVLVADGLIRICKRLVERLDCLASVNQNPGLVTLVYSCGA